MIISVEGNLLIGIGDLTNLFGPTHATGLTYVERKGSVRIITLRFL